jgi:hypothetical protein
MKTFIIYTAIVLPLIVIGLGEYIFLQGWDWKFASVLFLSGTIGEYMILDAVGGK